MTTTTMTLRQQARTDALQTARLQLDTERRAYDLCMANGWEWDARTAWREIARLKQWIARLTNEDNDAEND